MECHSKYTKMQYGLAQWHCWNGGFLCVPCYSKVKIREEKKVRQLSTLGMADILPVHSNKLLMEVWP